MSLINTLTSLYSVVSPGLAQPESVGVDLPHDIPSIRRGLVLVARQIQQLANATPRQLTNPSEGESPNITAMAQFCRSLVVRRASCITVCASNSTVSRRMFQPTVATPMTCSAFPSRSQTAWFCTACCTHSPRRSLNFSRHCLRTILAIMQTRAKRLGIRRRRSCRSWASRQAHFSNALTRGNTPHIATSCSVSPTATWTQ